MTTTSTIGHKTTVAIRDTPAGTPRQATCTCGWMSDIVPSTPLAEAHGAAHEAREATAQLRELRERIETERVSKIVDTVTTISPNPATHGMRVTGNDGSVSIGESPDSAIGESSNSSNSGPTPATGPVECAPWCAYDDDRGHPDRFFREDQWCGTEQLSVAMTSSHRSDEIRVSGLRRPDEAPVIEVDMMLASGDECGSSMTLAEAGQLVEALQLLLGQVGATAGVGR